MRFSVKNFGFRSPSWLKMLIVSGLLLGSYAKADTYHPCLMYELYYDEQQQLWIYYSDMYRRSGTQCTWHETILIGCEFSYAEAGNTHYDPLFCWSATPDACSGFLPNDCYQLFPD